MSELSPAAISMLAIADITPEQWIAAGGWFDVETDADGVRRVVRDGQWHGDSCGCTDDRCIGHHHDASDYCGCLPVLIQDFMRNREAYAVWKDYRAAVEANDGLGDQEAYEAAWKRAGDWIQIHHERALSFSLDAVVKGKRGISATFPAFADGRIPNLVSTVPDDDGYRQLLWSEDTDQYGGDIKYATGAVITS